MIDFLDLDTLTVIASSSSSSSDAVWVLLLPPLSGFVFFWMKFRKYRNTDKRHMLEHDTKTAVYNMKAEDDYVRLNKRERSSKIRGFNSEDYVRTSQTARGTYITTYGLDEADGKIKASKDVKE